MEILGINTKPEQDVYSNISGTPSRTVLWLDPRDRTCGVMQDYNDNSTSSDLWHDLTMQWPIADYPSEESMREWIVDNMRIIDAICDGHTVKWDGHNMVGRLTDDARDLADMLEDELYSGTLANYYEVYTVDSWIDSAQLDITADMSNAVLADLAEQWEGTKEIVIIDNRSILQYLTGIRDNLRFEMELESE